MGQLKDQIKQNLGRELYDDIYSFLSYYRKQANLDENLLYEEIKIRVDGDKKLMNEIFRLDGVVFQEILD